MYKRGDIFYADLGTGNDRCQRGIRPVIIVSNDIANTYSPVITVVPLTAQLKKINQPTHVVIHFQDAVGLNRTSMTLCEQVRSIDKLQLGEYVGYIINPSIMELITRALQIQIGVFPKW